MSIHNNLAVFTTILVARHCFSLQDLVIHVILPSLLAVKTGWFSLWMEFFNCFLVKLTFTNALNRILF